MGRTPLPPPALAPLLLLLVGLVLCVRGEDSLWLCSHGCSNSSFGIPCRVVRVGVCSPVAAIPSLLALQTSIFNQQQCSGVAAPSQTAVILTQRNPGVYGARVFFDEECTRPTPCPESDVTLSATLMMDQCSPLQIAPSDLSATLLQQPSDGGTGALQLKLSAGCLPVPTFPLYCTSKDKRKSDER